MGCCGMNMQLAKFAAEGEVLLRRDVLVAKEDHEVFGERAMDLVDLAIGARIVRDELSDIDTGNFRTDDRGELFDSNGLVGFALAGDVAVARTLLAGQ